MDSDSQITRRACANIPKSVPTDMNRWAKRALKLLIPVITQASLTREESHLAEFSIAVVESPAERSLWDGYVFDEVVLCSAEKVAKLAPLTKPTETYILTRIIKGELRIVGVGRPDPLVATWQDATDAVDTIEIADLYRHPFAFVGATVIGPCTAMIEGFSTELAFLSEGKLQPQANRISVALNFAGRHSKFATTPTVTAASEVGFHLS